MNITNFASIILAALTICYISICNSQTYSDLEALGKSCPARDKCRGYRNTLTYMDRSCECDDNCTAYRDCCIDALPTPTTRASRPPARTDVKCLHYGGEDYTGVYVIYNCSSRWNGPRQVRQRCVGKDNFTDPILAAPVTDVDRKITYRNLACAECNNANMASLQTFHIKLSCSGLTLTPDQIIGDLTYSKEYRLWGVNRLNRHGNETEFYGCVVVFDVPGYLNDSVRFCRSNLVSRCAAGWNRPEIAKLCARYLTVVYSNTRAYRNPHCAICNNIKVDKLSCMNNLSDRKRPMSFALLLDVNQSDGGLVGMRPVATEECPSGNIYDPFFKRCRVLRCALPGHIIVGGRCVRG